MNLPSHKNHRRQKNLFCLPRPVNHYLGGTLCSLALLSFGGVTQVSAAESGGFALEEVVVTARKREESLQDTPISITAFGSADLEARQLTSIHQISESTPNLVFDPSSTGSGSSAASSAAIRGVGQIDFTLNTDPAVGIYVDGVYLTRSIGGLVNLLDIERVEVLRGPQGTLFGRNTIGGAINITTVKPNENYEGRAEVTIGRFDQRDGMVTFNVPLTDNLYSRTSLVMRNRDGYMDRADGQEMADVDSQSGRVALRWLPTDDLEIDFSVDATKERQGSAAATVLAIDETAGLFPVIHNNFLVPGGACAAPSSIGNPQCYNARWVPNDEYFSYAGLDSRSDLDILGASGTVTWDLDVVTFKSITSYRDISSKSNLDFDYSPISIFDIWVSQEVETFSQEFQVLGTSFDDRLNWIVGTYYAVEDGDHIENIATPPFTFQSGGAVENESLAFFSQATFDITDRLSVTAGVRYTDDTREFAPDSYVISNVPLPSPPLPPSPPAGARLLPNAEFETNTDDVNPMFNISYAWTDNLNVYFTFSEGYKGGGFTQRIINPLPAPPSFDPEVVKMYEVGSKYTGLDNRLRLNFAIFHSDYSDIQVSGRIPGSVGTQTINAGEAEIDGFEMDMTFLPAEDWLIQAGVGYLDGDYTSLGADVVNINVNDPLPKTPQWTLNASVSYTYHINDRFDLTPRIDWSYRSEVANIATAGNDSFASQGAYRLVNASLALTTTDGKWKLVLSGKNLDDERYTYAGEGVDPFYGSAYGLYAPPRTWSLLLGYSWD